MQTLTEKTILITKANGATEPFNSSKLERSLLKSGASEKAVSHVLENISPELRDGMTTAEIYRHAFSMLHKMERPTALRYSLRKAIMELGPSGFPFEKYVGEVMKAHGYQVKIDQMVAGFCVEHEVDVVAWNDSKLIMAEAKFHNEQALKSDLKVALYVKSRMDDLKKATFEIAGKKRFLDEGWLVTNTKFSEMAIRYAKCQGMKLIGWSYPSNDSLQTLIEGKNLHPITCLTTLNKSDKEILLSNNIVLCKSISDDEQVLRKFNFDNEKIKNVMDEIKML